MTAADVPKRRRGAPSKRFGSIGDMVRSLGLMAVVLAVTLIFVPGLFHPSSSQRFPAVDYSDYVRGFRDLTGQPALVPGALPASWRANAGRLTGSHRDAHLHVGFAVPGSRYAGLEESVAPPAAFIKTVLGVAGVAIDGTQQIDGVSWDRRTSARHELALTRTGGAVTIVVTGSATPGQLATLAASLR